MNCRIHFKKERIEFAKNEVKKHPDLKRPVLTNHAPVQLVGDLRKYLKPQSEFQNFLTFTDSRELKMWQSINDEMDHRENARSLKLLGVEEAKIRRVLTQRHEERAIIFIAFGCPRTSQGDSSGSKKNCGKRRKM